MRRKTWLLLVVALAILSLGVAACGGDDDDEGEAGDTGQATDGEPAAEQEITMAWGAEPPSLDPGLATDTTSANVILNIMDPLVVLDENLEPQPALAESWEESEDGTTVTYHLREDGMWTNGDPVTAADFEYSWKRTLSPDLAADYAYQLYGIKGAAEYNGCAKNCDKLADEVGVKAVDDYTLEVTLTSPQPWFVGQSAHHSFLAVHQGTVEEFGEQWTEPGNIVTNGPFQLESWEHEASIDLVKWDEWRNADEVTLERVGGRIIVDGTTRVQAFEAGEVDALDGSGLPPAEMSRLKELEEYEQYDYLGTYYYGFNIENITDVNQRRAMSLAVDRRTIIDNIAQADQVPASGFTPGGIRGFDVINPASPWTPESGDLEQAQALMDEVASPKTDINLFHNNAPGHREIAVAVQDMWSDLGLSTTIKAQEWAQYLEFLGPPPSNQVDVYRLGWIYDYADAMNGLELWTCDSGNNNTNFCNEEYDALIDEARQTPEDDARFELYAQAEQIMFGEDGEMPLLPIYFYTLPNLEAQCIKDTFFIGALNSLDLTQVVVEGECS
ncbi:MAG TPA: peptide ABC transporter substrate-binding protein [Gaiellaceae bacterium]|nr:peptide ABC transporter substrate-binding protein [Gaiellaceae bacterium]